MDDGAALVSHPDPHRAVRSLAAQHGFHDQEHRGELATLFDGRGRSLRFLRRTGVSLDRFGEILFDAGVTARRLSVNDVLALLQISFDATPERPVSKGPSARTVTKAVKKAQRNRQRKFQCPDCHQIARASKTTLLDCGLCRDMHDRTVRMVRVDLLPEELAELMPC